MLTPPPPLKKSCVRYWAWQKRNEELERNKQTNKHTYKQTN